MPAPGGGGLAVWLLLLLTASRASAAEQRFARQPEDQTAIVGHKVTLPCRVVNKVGVLQWTKDDFGLGTHRNLSGFERYSMIGSDDEGDFSLEIFPVMLDDDARYQCQVGPGALGQPGIRSRFAHLTVLVPPEPPKIVQGDRLVTTEDREIELECISSAGKPPAEITWIDGFGNVLTEGVEYLKEELADGRRITARSILKFAPKKRHHNTTFTCQAQNAADRSYRAAHLRLEVKYAPKVTLTVAGPSTPDMASAPGAEELHAASLGASLLAPLQPPVNAVRLTEGAEVRLLCHADANPQNVTYRWFINDRPAPGHVTTLLVLTNVTRAYHDAIVKCQAHNAVGKSEESETLDIAYGPRFRSKPRSVQADTGNSVTLVCDVDGNPTPDIVWVHEDAVKVVGSTPNLTLEADKSTAGRYRCKASVPGFHEIGAEASILLKGPPMVTSPRIQFGVLGDTVKVECSASAVPKPDHVAWTHEGHEITSDVDYTILEDTRPGGVVSTLVIREAENRHFGGYNCTVVNAYGAAVADIELKPQKSFPLLMILAGVIGGVVVIIAIALLIILCHRRGDHKPRPDSRDAEKQCKESDRSSNISDLKMELRTASSVSNVHCELEYGPADSETGSESVATRVGVPLAGPVTLPSAAGALGAPNGGPHDHRLYRYSAEFAEPTFPPKDGHNNNGYVPYVDYSRDYNPPPPPPPLGLTTQITTPGTDGSIGSRESIPAPMAAIDPRYSAVYGNPYLRTSSSSLPAPAGQPPPPPYSAAAAAAAAARNGAAPQVARLPNTTTTQYIVPSSQQRGALATHV